MSWIGCVDTISETCISGWAAESEHLACRIGVDILVNSAIVATVCCDEFRVDLQAAGIGDGCKAFHYDPSAHLKPGRNIVEVRYAGTDLVVHQGRGRWVKARPAAGTPEHALLAALEAYHEFTPQDHICWIGDGGHEFGRTLVEAQVPFRRFSVLTGPDPAFEDKTDVMISAPGTQLTAGSLQYLVERAMNCPGLLVVGFPGNLTAPGQIQQTFQASGIAGVKLESIAPWHAGAAIIFAFAEVSRARPLLAHIHVPKCAGTSFRILMQRHFQARHLCLYVNDTYFVYSPETLRSYLLQNPDIAGFSSHHVRSFPRWMAGRRMLYITFLRDPIEQFVSYMTHIKKYYSGITSPSLMDAVPPDAPQLPLRDFARWLLTQERDVPFRENHNVNFFARNRPDPADRLEAAKAVLDDFFFVGITEEMEESMSKLRARAREAGLDFPSDPMLYENVSNDYRDDLSWINPQDEVGSLLLRSVEKDRQLYDWAVARLEKLLD